MNEWHCLPHQDSAPDNLQLFFIRDPSLVGAGCFLNGDALDHVSGCQEVDAFLRADGGEGSPSEGQLDRVQRGVSREGQANQVGAERERLSPGLRETASVSSRAPGRQGGGLGQKERSTQIVYQAESALSGVVRIQSAPGEWGVGYS